MLECNQVKKVSNKISSTGFIKIIGKFDLTNEVSFNNPQKFNLTKESRFGYLAKEFDPETQKCLGNYFNMYDEDFTNDDT